MRRIFRRLIRRVNTTEWSVSWFEVLPGEDPSALAGWVEDGALPRGRSGTRDEEQVASDEDAPSNEP